ncbi:uncharacterized protein DDB_G0287317-like isoform X3 [Macrosteles quadrilineatus]|uniref:uncharacterized protein DDB_G0287317-like isoform X3 n=1 Tax=Macrosteles quadrilineatus TaxID=74068 RepID=UPI0023E33F27|nr:uncharacterized protein DDB_G0287317-like isoform X3 [Macrosteles quadrilineatus]
MTPTFYILLISVCSCKAGFLSGVTGTTSTVKPPDNIFGKLVNNAEQFGGKVITSIFSGNSKVETNDIQTQSQGDSVADRLKEESPSTETSTDTVVGESSSEASRSSPTDTSSSSSSASPGTTPDKKAPVPVGDDGGRTVADAPVRECDSGRRDSKGRCRELFRK